MAYIDEEGLRNVKKHKYTSCPYPPFSRFLSVVLWEPVSRWMPRWLAPNLITIIATSILWVSTMILMLQNDLSLSKPPPSYTWVLVSVSVFLYELLDAVDGKHARNLGCSSPLGQLLDHGLDCSYSSGLVSLLLGFLLDMDEDWVFPVLLMGIQSTNFYPNWEEYYHGVFRFNISVFGVDEALYLIIGFALATGAFGSEIWKYELFWGISYGRTVGIVTILGLLGSFVFFTNINIKKKGFGVLRDLTPMLMSYLGLWLLVSSPSYLHYKALLLIATIGNFGIIPINMIVCVFTKTKFVRIRTDVCVFFALCCFLYFSQPSFVISVVMAIAFNLNTLYYLAKISQEIAEFLGISVLKVKVS